MNILIFVLILIVALLLVGAVLIQNSKGGGIASNVGINQQMIGAARSAESIEKITWYLISGLAVLCIVSGFFFSNKISAGTDGNTNGIYTPKNFDENVIPTNVQPNSTAPTQTPPPATK